MDTQLECATHQWPCHLRKSPASLKVCHNILEFFTSGERNIMGNRLLAIMPVVTTTIAPTVDHPMPKRAERVQYLWLTSIESQQLFLQCSLAPSYRLSAFQCGASAPCTKLQTYPEICADSLSTILHHTGHCSPRPTTPRYMVYTTPTSALELKSSLARVPLSCGDQTYAHLQ